MPGQLDLSSQIAVVSGASGGIGGAIAAAFARQGATLCLLGRDINKLEARAEVLRASSPRVDPRQCDLTRDDEIKIVQSHVMKQYGRVDILVHCGGGIDHGKVADTPLPVLDHLYETNVRGPMMLTQVLLPLLKKPRGQIVFINSSAGLATRPGAGYFSATQHAFKALAESIRDEVNADGVRVLSVYPGRTATPRIQALHAKEGRPYQPELLLQPDDIASVVLNAVTLPWTAEVMDISLRPMRKSYLMSSSASSLFLRRSEPRAFRPLNWLGPGCRTPASHRQAGRRRPL
jgi:NADP-dependent 3-hydroxy acid dehydrogenase YdfG